MNKNEIDALTTLLKESGSSQSEIDSIIKLKTEEHKNKTWETRRSWLALLISVVAIVMSGINPNAGSSVSGLTAKPNIAIEGDQHPTRDEWLRVYISYSIHELTDLWQLRVAANVAVISEDAEGKPIIPKQLIVTITSANGEAAIIGDTADQYKQYVEILVKSILKKYSVESEYELTVQTL